MIVNPNRIGFSAKTSLFLGLYGTAEVSLANVGLLGRDATFNAQQTFRTKLDGYPEVPAAEALQAQSGEMQLVLREWTATTLQAALGLGPTDTTFVVGGDTVVVNEAVTLNLNGVGVLARPFKASVAPVVTSANGVTVYAAGTDYVLVPRDMEGRSLIVRSPASTIPAGASLLVDYTWTAVGNITYPGGKVSEVRYRTAKLVETRTYGGKVELFIPRCRIGINGNITFNAAENGADLPITIQAVQDPTRDFLFEVRDFDAA